MANVYKITYPNGKIYVGVDFRDEISYFGSVNPGLVAEDFAAEERRDFTVRKELLWESDTATKREALQIEIEWIRKLASNNPAVGYNRSPKWTGGT